MEAARIVVWPLTPSPTSKWLTELTLPLSCCVDFNVERAELTAPYTLLPVDVVVADASPETVTTLRFPEAMTSPCWT